jgi:phosphoribosylglycinamide formyltransferase-1
MKSVVVLLSGTGTNLQAILDATQEADLGYKVGFVISNCRRAGGLEKARKAGVPSRHVDPRLYANREAYDRALSEVIDGMNPDLIVLAGFMRILSPFFVRRYAGCIVNVHPSLLPAFPGKDAQAQALSAGVRESGVTIHFVDEGVDTGPIIAQEAVSVDPGETVETLSAKIQVVEHRLYPSVIATVCERLTENKDSMDTLRGGYYQ